MIFKWSLLIACAYLSTCYAAFVDTLNKCPVKDEDCLKNLIQKILKDISKNGIEEYNIPPIDPIKLKNINVSILNLFNLTMEDTVVKGFKDCVVDHVDVPIEKGKAVFELTCDASIKGKHKAEGSSPLLKNLFGSESVRSDGNFKLKLGKLHVTLIFFYDIMRKGDGEVYFDCRRKEFQYKYSIGDFNMQADKIFLGKTDASKIIVDFLNQNWKTLIQSVGKNFFDVAMEIFNDILHRFFENTPTKYYLIEDLSSYIKK